MKKQDLLTGLILVISVLISTVESYGYTEVGQTVQLAAQPAVSVKKVSAKESGFINAYNGSHEGMNASFLLQTNGTDDDYDFIVNSTLTISEGTYSGFSKNGNLLFINTNARPTVEAVNDAIQEGSKNPNVIVYPFEVEVTSPMTAEYGTHSTQGNCYMIKVNNQSEGTINQIVKGSAVTGTYNLGIDQAGPYQAVVYITTVSK